ncbi:hypothetical protein SELMODRAFT_420503 [Selaginella moellendorffii]|uniref:Uncharacterized protein n=1 Tax=Selaginella moellendorffii TaxID=88036 RepID=D8SC73_SELML|nr:hypothetical protein SELMODRAFT_420503 [Selaginella moellendorffii]
MAQLNKALWCDREVFATGGAEKIDLPIKSVCQQAPYGLGERTLVDTDVRRAWQINPERVSCPEVPNFFSSVAHDLAAHGLSVMGLDSTALGLDGQDGMFATMILQLPTSTGHSGGALAVRQGRQCCEFDFSDGSSSHYFSTIFFCDCEHQLKEVTSGSRLCLVFSLVRSNVEFIPAENVPSFVSALPRTIKTSARVTGRVVSSWRFLWHKYSKTSLSFAGLKGHDRVVAALVRACEFLELHLCMLTKHKTVTDDSEVEYVIDNWIRADDQPAKFMKWNIDIKQEVLKTATNYGDDDDADLFDFLEDEFQGTGMMAGNEGGTDQYFYHVAVLVVWPKGGLMRTICSSVKDITWVLDWMRENGGDFAAPGSLSRAYLQEIVTSLTHRFDSLAPLLERSYYNEREELLQGPAMLLEVCIKSGLSDEALSIMRSWNVELIEIREFANAVQAYGWEVCKEVVAGVIKCVEKTPPKKQVSFLWQDESGEAPAWHAAVMKLGGFPSRLRDQVGYQDGAIGAAKLLCAKLIANSTELPAEFQGGFTKREDDGITLLVEFCLEAGLQEEASQILGKLTLQRLDGRTLAKVMRSFSSRSAEVERAWDERKKMAEDRKLAEEEEEKKPHRFYGYGYSRHSSGSSLKGKSSGELCEAYVRDMVEFMLELESLGHHNEALGFAARPFPCDCAARKFTEKSGPGMTNLQEHWIVVMLLLNKPELILDKSRFLLGESERCVAIITMEKAAGLVGLKNNEAAKKVLVKLCVDQLVSVADLAETSTWTEYHGGTSSGTKKDRFCNYQDFFKTWKDQKKFFELLLWLEEEELLGAMVECVSKRANLLRRMLAREEGLVDEAMKLGDGVKRATRKLVEARMEYVSKEPILGDVVDKLEPASKKLKLCREFDARRVIGNPRQQRRVYEIVVEEWKGDSAARSIEMEELQALQQLL